MNDRDARWHDLYIVDILTGERRLVYENKDEIASLILDSRLNLRLATTTRNKGRGAAILRWTGAAFEEIMSIEADDVLCTDPLHVNRAGDAWFLRSSVGRDKAVILRVDWNTGAETPIASHDKADVTGWITDPRTDEVTAVSAEYLRSEWIAVDPSTGSDLAKLERELDGTIEIWSQSDDDTLWVVAASRPDRPHVWHLFDRRSGKITYLFSARPKLEKVKLAPMHGLVIKSRDGLDLVSYLTLPATETGSRPARPLPMVLKVHGGPWWRDGWHYNRDVQWYANRNYAVLQVNYRGSTGFGKAFTNAGDREWAGKMHDDLIDAVNWASPRASRIPSASQSAGPPTAVSPPLSAPRSRRTFFAAACLSSVSPTLRPCSPIRRRIGLLSMSRSAIASATRARPKASRSLRRARRCTEPALSRSRCSSVTAPTTCAARWPRVTRSSRR